MPKAAIFARQRRQHIYPRRIPDLAASSNAGMLPRCCLHSPEYIVNPTVVKATMTTLYIDADACPVKDEAERVATRMGVPMVLVCNRGLRPSRNPLVSLVIVDEGPDEADQWIAARCGAGDVVVTADIPLADRCIKALACVITPTGEELRQTNIGQRLATRDLMSDIRAADPFFRGSSPAFSKADSSRFLQALDTALATALRKR